MSKYFISFNSRHSLVQQFIGVSAIYFFSITFTLILLSGDASADLIMQATFTGNVQNAFFILPDGTTEEAGFGGTPFTAVFTYDSATMQRTQTMGDLGISDRLESGPALGLPIGINSVSLTVSPAIQPLVPTIFGTHFFTKQIHPLFMQHYAADINADGSFNFIEFFFLGYDSGATGVVSPPTSVFEEFDISIPRFPCCPVPLVTGNFSYVVPASEDFGSYTFFGNLESYSIHITAIPEPSSGILVGLASIAICGFRRRG